MRRVIVAVAFIVAVGSSAAIAEAPSPTSEQATVVKLVVKRPPKIVHRRAALQTPTRPGTARVLQITRPGGALGGVPPASLSRRVSCESHYHWWASNGQYSGVLQFAAGTFYRGLRTLRTRKVVITRR